MLQETLKRCRKILVDFLSNRLFIASLCSIAILIPFSSAPADAVSGILDPSFGVGGKVFLPGSPGDVAVQSDGKVIHAGSVSGDFSVARFNADGSVDHTFGAGGTAVADFGATLVNARAVAIQADGKIVVAGAFDNCNFNCIMAIARFNSDGSLDSSFGTGGQMTTFQFFNLGPANAVLIQPDGKILLGGTGGLKFIVVRLNSDGSLDTSFDGDGRANTPIGFDSSVNALALQADGKIVAAGYASMGGSTGLDFALARYNTDGSLDAGFGTGGIVTTHMGTSSDAAWGVVVQPDGNIVAGGSVIFGTQNTGLARYLPNGTLDPAFGSGGKVVTQFGRVGFVGTDIALQPDGKIVIGARGLNSNDTDFGVARINADGTPDTTFGSGGSTLTPMGCRTFEEVRSIALQPDGKVLVTGFTFTGIGLARYGEGVLPSTDTVAPTTLSSVSPAANAAGWNNSDVTVTLNASDNTGGSGLNEIRYRIGSGPELFTCDSSISIPITAEGTTTVTYRAVDNAGNFEALKSTTVKIDRTPPSIISTQSPAANAAGWNNTDVTVSFSGSDSLSGGVQCTPSGSVLTGEGAGQSVGTTCTDAAGNSAQGSRTIHIDKTAPTALFGAASPAPNGAGWNNTNVSVPFTASDTLSGVAEVNPATPLTLSSEGAAVTGSVTVTDSAGNSATFASPAFKIDKTPPAVTASQSPAANGAGWNNTDVTVTFAATDALSGGGTCTVSSVLLTGEGAALTAATSCTDQAGNSQSASRTVQIDRTAPALTMPVFQASYPSGSSITLSFGAADSLSGIASLSAALNGTPVSNGQTVTLTQAGVNTFTLASTDAAGNTASQSATFTVQSPYQFSEFLPPLTPGGIYHLGRVIPVKFRLTDSNGALVSSAVANLSLQQFSGEDPVGDPIDATSVSGADSGSLFRFDGSQYIYNLDTRSLSAGTWVLRATLDNGSVYTIQIGLKSK
ncbi:MAG: hypothetical protein EPO39_07310 [Candidatus Manganitrophaceae bacterium]|nr:MAG: hypothetical protein EPO39_07310 [Candidatus Manganitrophaceae bacterium]